MELTEGLAQLSPLQIDGVPHDIWLLDMRVDPRTRGAIVEVKVAARNPSGRHYIGRFRIETARLHEEGVARAVATMEVIIRHGLPPTAESSF